MTDNVHMEKDSYVLLIVTILLVFLMRMLYIVSVFVNYEYGIHNLIMINNILEIWLIISIILAITAMLIKWDMKNSRKPDFGNISYINLFVFATLNMFYLPMGIHYLMEVEE